LTEWKHLGFQESIDYRVWRLVLKHVSDGRLKITFDASNEKFGVPFFEANANYNLASLNYLDNTGTNTFCLILLHLKVV
jgi:hypothetical protein